MVVGVFLILEGKTTVADVVEVLEPFKVRDCHTTSIDIQVRDNEDVLLKEDLVSSQSSWTVSSLSDNLATNINKIFFDMKLHQAVST